MTEPDVEDLPEPITVEYTATLRYEAWEVDDFEITGQSAIENLLDGVRREPSNFGEIEVRRE